MSSDNDITVWPVCKLLPLIDSFQGVFAGLLFLWRAIITAIFAFSSTLTEFHVLTEVALVTFFAIHAVARPYKRRLYNIINAVMFANLAIINDISWYEATEHEMGEHLSGSRILLMYLPLACLATLLVLWMLQKCGILPKNVRLTTAHEESASDGNMKVAANDISSEQNGDMCADDRLFDRAEELNRTPALILSGGEKVFEPKTKETTITLNTETNT